MENLNRFRILNQLKLVKRATSVGNRCESTAEHTWSTLMLADYYMEKYDFNVDKHKVLELLMYHDVVEIIAGDTALEPGCKRTEKMAKEFDAAKKLKQQLPQQQGQKFYDLFMEFENKTTKEAKFAKAMDALDAMIHELDYKKDWKGWSPEFLIEKKGSFFKEFPQLQTDFHKLLDYAQKNGYFDQK